MQINNTKNELRKHFKSIRVNIDALTKAEYDKCIARQFLESDVYKNCDTLLCYVSMDIEVDTLLIIETALKQKKVLCPRCEPSGNTMYFYRVNSFEELERGKFNVLEPKQICEQVNEFTEKSLCLVPALSYDKNGYRLGFGKGYYDRFLSNFNGIKVGLCYESCISEQLPTDTFDEKVNLLITDNQTRFFI